MKTLAVVPIFFLLAWHQTQAQIASNTRLTSEDTRQQETAVAVSPLSPALLFVAWHEEQDDFFKAAFAFTTNGGSTWNRGIVPDANPEYRYGVIPSVAIDRQGNAFVAYIATRSADPIADGAKIVVARTSNYGASWTRTFLTVDTKDDFPSIAVDNTGIAGNDGRVYVSWTTFASGQSQIRYAYSNDNGFSFVVGPALDSASDPLPPPFSYPKINMGEEEPKVAARLVQGATIRVSSTGDVLVMWNHEDYPISTLKLRKSTDGGLNFGPVMSSQNLQYVVADGYVGVQYIYSVFHTSFAINPVQPNKIYATFTSRLSHSPLAI